MSKSFDVGWQTRFIIGLICFKLISVRYTPNGSFADLTPVRLFPTMASRRSQVRIGSWILSLLLGHSTLGPGYILDYHSSIRMTRMYPFFSWGELISAFQINTKRYTLNFHYPIFYIILLYIGSAGSAERWPETHNYAWLFFLYFLACLINQLD
jgi:hypothetical protein